MSAADLPGFDAADPTTWHPANGTVVGVLQAASAELGIRLGANLAPTAERIARALRPPAADLIAEVRRLRAELATAQRAAIANARERDDLLEQLDGRHR